MENRREIVLRTDGLSHCALLKMPKAWAGAVMPATPPKVRETVARIPNKVFFMNIDQVSGIWILVGFNFCNDPSRMVNAIVAVKSASQCLTVYSLFASGRTQKVLNSARGDCVKHA